MRAKSVAASSESGAQVVDLEILEPQLTTGPSFEEIQRRAYELYVERGCVQGCDQDNWLEAERELKQGYQRSSLA
ncbi:MAG TPA: DUF2934 domain-containing protein [Candidatus Acidoferrales bacterium]